MDLVTDNIDRFFIFLFIIFFILAPPDETVASAGVLDKSMGARNLVGIGLSYWPARARIGKSLRSPGIDPRNQVRQAM
jgi:hypothetical protein